MPAPFSKLNFALQYFFDCNSFSPLPDTNMQNIGKIYYYFIAAMPAILAADQYIPKSEINLALTCLRVLQQDKRPGFTLEVYWTLLQHALCLTDLAIHRNPSDETTLLETLEHALEQLSSNFLRRASQYKLKGESSKPYKSIIKNSKSTGLFLKRIGACETNFLSTENNVLTETELLPVLSKMLPDFYDRQEEIRSFIKGFMQGKTDLVEEQLKQFLADVMSTYFRTIENHDWEWDHTDDAKFALEPILLIINTLFYHAVNQRAFYQIFLTVHQQCLLQLKESRHEYRQLSVLNYLAIFTQSIPLEELVDFLEQHSPVSDERWDRHGLQIEKKLLCENDFWSVFERPNNLQTLSSVYIKILGNDLALVHKERLSDYVGNVPIFMHLLPTITRDAFYELYTTASRINSNAADAHRINLPVYFMTKQTVISNLIHLMDVDGVALLRKKLAGTLLSFMRFCDNLPKLLPPASLDAFVFYYETYRSLITSDQQEAQAWSNLLLMLHLFSHMKDEDDESYFSENIVLDIAHKPSEVLFVWGKIILSSIFYNEDSDSEEVSIDIDRLVRMVSFEHLPKFVMAFARLQDEVDVKIYQQLLICDLTGESVDDFLHNLMQDNELGVGLAHHNKAIRDALLSHHILPDSALDYKKTDEIILIADGADSSNYPNSLLVLWSYAKKLVVLAEREQAKLNLLLDDKGLVLSNVLGKIIASVLELQAQTIETIHTTTRRLSTEQSSQLFAKIMKNLTLLKNSKADFSAEFGEFSDHYSQQYAVCSNLKASRSAVKKPSTPYYFRIEQWSKNHPMTFFLGDDVGCCLSTTGAQFRAMLYRRIDDAMLFHVAIDLKTGKPAALIWLYLADTRQGTVTLIANFFEVNAKYAENNQLRMALLQSLLSFTHQYCLDNPNIDGFYMAPLTYGWNITDLESYPRMKLRLSDKVGEGFTDDYLSREVTINTYHLPSLCSENDTFHRFDPTILEQTKVSGCYQLRKLLSDWVNELMPNTPEQIQTIIVEKHPLELIPFFSTPLEDDAELKLIIQTFYEHYMEKSACPIKSEASLLVKFGQFSPKETVVNHDELVACAGTSSFSGAP